MDLLPLEYQIALLREEYRNTTGLPITTQASILLGASYANRYGYYDVPFVYGAFASPYYSAAPPLFFGYRGGCGGRRWRW